MDTPSARPTAFAAIPFDGSFADVFHVGMVPAATAVGLSCVRVDQTFHGSDSVAESQRQIAAARVVIADVTNAQRDVLYELGYAHALGVPTVQICATSFVELPFSIRNRDTLPYELGRTYLLASRLEAYLRRLLEI